jgi:hypothetical protein
MFSFIRRLFGRKKGGTRWKLQPAPVMPDTFTIGQVEAVCAILDLDVDLVISGDFVITDLKKPPLERASELLKLLCVNGHKYNPREWTPGQYEGVMGALLANFMFRLAIS